MSLTVLMALGFLLSFPPVFELRLNWASASAMDVQPQQSSPQAPTPRVHRYQTRLNRRIQLQVEQEKAQASSFEESMPQVGQFESRPVPVEKLKTVAQDLKEVVDQCAAQLTELGRASADLGEVSSKQTRLEIQVQKAQSGELRCETLLIQAVQTEGEKKVFDEKDLVDDLLFVDELMDEGLLEVFAQWAQQQREVESLSEQGLGQTVDFAAPAQEAQTGGSLGGFYGQGMVRSLQYSELFHAAINPLNLETPQDLPQAEGGMRLQGLSTAPSLFDSQDLLH
ncbi:MAG: hypothetical protein ACO3A2_00965 [Bdellovibrionia bacterium]